MLSRLIGELLGGRRRTPAELAALGREQRERGDANAALATLHAALRHDSGNADVLCELGLTYRGLGRANEARAALEQALACNPGSVPVLMYLGNLDHEDGREADAVRRYSRALELDPGNAAVRQNLSVALSNLGQNAASLEEYKRACELEPQRRDPALHGSLVYGLHLDAGADPERIAAEHFFWARRFADPSALPASHDNNRDRGRRLRVGYVSGDLFTHAVANLIEPVLREHNRAEFEVTCYYTRSVRDDTTVRLRDCADRWREIEALNDAAAAQLIRADEIDILVDLSGHTPGNRLQLFARRPAPVQATWLGYPQTSGLSQIEYRISDSQLDPPGLTEKLHSEKLLRLPQYLGCFDPDPGSPEPGPLPALDRGYVTFASFNHYSKVNDGVVSLWCRLLREIGNARLLLVARGGDLAPVREKALHRFEQAGAPMDRIRVVGKRPLNRFLELHREVDVALDPFPYSGAVTTLNNLWMGVPVITLAGIMPISRQGAALLNALGLTEFIASDEAGYLGIARRCASDIPGLAALRAQLRARMRASSLVDAARFTRHLETLYHGMWKAWRDA